MSTFRRPITPPLVAGERLDRSTFHARYEAMPPDTRADMLPGPDGVLRSEVFPGLWLDPSALLADDMDRLVATLERGTGTPEHAEFVALLAARRGG